MSDIVNFLVSPHTSMAKMANPRAVVSMTTGLFTGRFIMSAINFTIHPLATIPLSTVSAFDGINGCGGRIWTSNLQVMSITFLAECLKGITVSPMYRYAFGKDDFYHHLIFHFAYFINLFTSYCWWYFRQNIWIYKEVNPNFVQMQNAQSSLIFCFFLNYLVTFYLWVFETRRTQFCYEESIYIQTLVGTAWYFFPFFSNWGRWK